MSLAMAQSGAGATEIDEAIGRRLARVLVASGGGGRVCVCVSDGETRTRLDSMRCSTHVSAMHSYDHVFIHKSRTNVS